MMRKLSPSELCLATSAVVKVFRSFPIVGSCQRVYTPAAAQLFVINKCCVYACKESVRVNFVVACSRLAGLRDLMECVFSENYVDIHMMCCVIVHVAAIARMSTVARTAAIVSDDLRNVA